MKLPIYMDNHATTPCDPRVAEAMMPYLTQHFGNAASRNHPFGWVAEEAVEKARGQIAELIGATAKEIVFTSGATESNNMALKGALEFYASRGKHIVTSPLEHKAIIDTVRYLERNGAEVTWLPVAAHGVVDPEDVRAEARAVHPLRTIGTPTDMANLVNWLASTEARYASGQLWVLDGGLSAQVQQMRL